VELHIAGYGTDSDDMRRMVNACEAKNHVILHGALDKEGMRRLYEECDAVALATRSEVQPLALLEAMSTGIPYVSTTAVPRSERFEGAGITVPIDDVAAFAQAMDSMVTTSSNGRMISEKVRQMAAPAVVARQLESIFRTAIGKDACN
jgi:glycosyltransferase involved in cell wall biosynthesis